MKSKFLTTALKGFIIIIPVIALVLLFQEFYDLISTNVNKIMDTLGIESHLQFFLVLLVSAIIILFISYGVGLITNTDAFKKFSKTLDEQLQSLSKTYRNIKLQFDNSTAFLLEDRPPIFVRFGNVERPGFLIETDEAEQKAVIFIPKKYNDFDGNVYVVALSDIRRAKDDKNDFVLSLNHLGQGLNVS